jgi:hypothetical protein
MVWKSTYKNKRNRTKVKREGGTEGGRRKNEEGKEQEEGTEGSRKRKDWNGS